MGSLVNVREAALTDAAPIKAFLDAHHVTSEGILADGTRYWIVEDAAGRMIGVAGVELDQQAALLRSLVVADDHLRSSVGVLMVRRVLAACREAGITQLYCFTGVGNPFWKRFGFSEVPLDDLLTALPDVPLVRDLLHRGQLMTQLAWRKAL